MVSGRLRASFRRLVVLAGLALAIATGCDVDDDARSAPTPDTSALGRAMLLARHDSSLSRILSRSRVQEEIDDDSLRVGLPAKADGWVELRSGARASPLARFRLIGAAARELAIESGIGIHRAALGGNDVLYATTPDLVEQLVLLDKSEPFALTWELCTRTDLQPSLSGGAFVVMDANGEERLRIPEPFAIDARGERRTLSLRHRAGQDACHELEFALEARGLTAPILVDPAVEAVSWQKKKFVIGAPQPPDRYDHGMAWDPVRKVSVLFGGRANGNDPMFGDTWEWDGVEWKKKLPTVSPAARTYFGMAYSALHGGVVLFGGLVGNSPDDSNPNAEVWKYDGTTWSPLPAGPPPLAAHRLAFDSKRNVVVIYGGRDFSKSNKAVWELGATGWSAPIQPADNPGTLLFFAMTYDSVMERTLLFGGYTNDVTYEGTDLTWAWDGTSWTEVTNLGNGPGERADVAADFDSKRKRSVFFGGGIDVINNNQTWELSQANGWDLRGPLTKPYAMSSTKAAYDAARDRYVIFGGYTSHAEGDTFEYAHFGNTCSVAGDCDGYPCLDGVCCSVESCGTCEACSAVTGKCAPVVSADDADSCTGATTCDELGTCAKKNGQGCDGKQECASGFCSNGVCCNALCNGTCESCGLTGSVGTCSLVVGSPVFGSCPGSGPCGSSCDGKQAECSFAPDGSDCGTSCEGIDLVARACDGNGACVSSAPATCAQHYACASGSSCNTTCSDESDCAPGFFCFDSKCSDGKDVCLDEVTAQDPGGSQTHCAPYRCQDGKCAKRCNAAADCAPGSLCTADRHCQPKPGSPEADDAGCGCRAGRDENGNWGLLLAVALIWVRRRRNVT